MLGGHATKLVSRAAAPCGARGGLGVGHIAVPRARKKGEVCVFICSHIHTHTKGEVCVFICSHTYTHTHTHTCTHTHTHTTPKIDG